MRSREAVFVAAMLIGGASRGAETAPVRYSRDVQPILAKNCFACHGPDDAHREAELRLDTAAGAIAALPSGERAVVPDRPDASELLRRVTSDDADVRMPPAKHGTPLSPEQIDVLRRWIAAGGNYDRHWSFTPPAAAAPPTVRDESWVRNDLDRFILARLEADGLKPNAEAEPAVLVRRLYLDLIGLPPTPDEVAEFVADKNNETLVNRLLASPHFGERWARPWLDVARYADSRGYGSDPLRTNIWPYRDWVIGAFNQNLPYDEFVVEQLAGDLLPDAMPEQRIATAFHRNTMTNTEGGTDDEEFRTAAVHDRTHVTMQAFMGLTMGCAKCHNHKFDPLTQADYYRLFAVFNQSEDADKPDESPTMPLPDRDAEKKSAERAALQKELDAAKARQKELDEAVKKDPAADVADKSGKKESERLKSRVKDLDRKIAALVPLAVPVMRELPADKRRATYVLVKGNFLVKGATVEPGLPGAFHEVPLQRPDRLALARWIVDPQNPLTARVAVNRAWAQLFGIGLVETEEDFGIQGVAPSHPELLDWLAVEFRDKQDWNFKRLLKLVVTSAAYRQSSHVSPQAAKLDPRNRLLSHAPRYRLEAELVRDQALALAGLLSPKIGGPSVHPYQPAGLWQAAFNGERTWTTSAGEDRYRRGLYTFWRRTIPYPSMATFDAPSREICAVRRVRTNTPLQALVTLNDPVYVEAAQAMARRILREGGLSTDERLRFAIRLCICREPKSEQIAALAKLVEAELDRYRADAAAAKKLATEPLGPLPEGLDTAEAAAWTVVANVLLNLDAVLTRS